MPPSTPFRRSASRRSCSRFRFSSMAFDGTMAAAASRPQAPVAQPIRSMNHGGGWAVAGLYHIGIAQPFCRCRHRCLVAPVDQGQRDCPALPRRRCHAPRLRPTAWSTAWPACRRPPPSSTTARPSARASTACTRPALVGMDGAHDRRPRQMRRVPLEQVRRPAQPVDHARRNAPRRRPRRWPPPPRARPAAGSAASPPSASASPHSSSTTSSSRGCAGSPLSMAMLSATSTALPAVWPRHWPISVSSARVGSPAPRATPTMLSRQRRRLLVRRHEGARAGLHVHHQRLQPAGQLLGEDRGGDQRDALDRRGDVADGVEPPVGRGEVVGLADDGAARSAHHRPAAGPGPAGSV